MVIGPSGNYMQVIIEHLDDLIWFGMKKLTDEFDQLLRKELDDYSSCDNDFEDSEELDSQYEQN